MISMSPRRTRGVTLIELMIVVVILAIIASIAVPSYRSYLLRAQRSDATAALLRVRTAQEKFFLQNNVYADDAELSVAPPNGLGIDATTEHGHYQLNLETPDPDRPGIVSFRVTATATGGQTDDGACRTFTVNDQGERTASDSGGTDNTAKCWR